VTGEGFSMAQQPKPQSEWNIRQLSAHVVKPKGPYFRLVINFFTHILKQNFCFFTLNFCYLSHLNFSRDLLKALNMWKAFFEFVNSLVIFGIPFIQNDLEKKLLPNFLTKGLKLEDSVDELFSNFFSIHIQICFCCN